MANYADFKTRSTKIHQITTITKIRGDIRNKALSPSKLSDYSFKLAPV